MKVLVACEESQAVCKAFREKGHEAYSCDIIECSGGHPEWHIRGDVLKVLNPTRHCTPAGDVFEGIEFKTVDGVAHTIQPKWDLIIAFPPCTFLTLSGNRWFDAVRYGYDAQDRWHNRCLAICFFLSFAYADCEKIAIENPIGCMSTYFRKPNQIIRPWQFAINAWEKVEKATCLWLKGLSELAPVHKEKPEMAYHEWTTSDGKKKRQTMWYYNTRCLPHKERATAASKTFPGVAKAMAEQWG